MIDRQNRRNQIQEALGRNRVVLLSGARQCGKTTLARTFVRSDSINYFDLEDPISLARLDQPMTALGSLRGLVVIDEIQRRPELFPVLRVLADRTDIDAQFLVLGSASGALLRQASESLAGRLEVVPMEGFVIGEAQEVSLDQLWLRGGFPRSLLARSDQDSWIWRKQFATTLIERDLPAWGVNVPSATMFRFWQTLAHYHGQTWNASELARLMGLSQPVVRRYLDIMTDAFVVRQVQPLHANIAKRQVKSPKVYVRDTGILHYLLGVHSMKDLVVNPRLGASWEGFAIENIISIVRPDAYWFWATHGGAEIDLILELDGRRIGVECKRQDAPRVTASMHQAMQDLELNSILVVYPGLRSYDIADRIQALPLADVHRIRGVLTNGNFAP